MDSRLTNFYKHFQKYFLHKLPMQEPCLGCYMIDGKEIVLPFVALDIKIGLFPVVLN